MFGASKYREYLKHPGYNDIGSVISAGIGLISSDNASSAATDAAAMQANAQREAAKLSLAAGLPTSIYGHPMGGFTYDPGSFISGQLGFPTSSGTSTTTPSSSFTSDWVVNQFGQIFPASYALTNPNAYEGGFTPLTFGSGTTSASGATSTNGTTSTSNSSYLPSLTLNPSQAVLDIINNSGNNYTAANGMLSSFMAPTYQQGVGNYYDLLQQIMAPGRAETQSKLFDTLANKGLSGLTTYSGTGAAVNPYMNSLANANNQADLSALLQADSMYNSNLTNLANLTNGLLTQYTGAMKMPEEVANFGKNFSTGALSGASNASQLLASAGQTLAQGQVASSAYQSDFWNSLGKTISGSSSTGSISPFVNNIGNLFSSLDTSGQVYDNGSLVNLNDMNWWN